jgi:hypothetical protein
MTPVRKPTVPHTVRGSIRDGRFGSSITPVEFFTWCAPASPATKTEPDDAPGERQRVFLKKYRCTKKGVAATAIAACELLSVDF